MKLLSILFDQVIQLARLDINDANNKLVFSLLFEKLLRHVKKSLPLS